MKAFYCVGTHWDREWYKPFQEYRMWLVELIDELMELMELYPEYKSFHLDGQTIVLEDYLEIRPERKELLVRLLKERRLLAGPWYNLPDEWLISGESFIRNLMRGVRICRELGFPPLNFAYTPDQFGHIAALPMIMQGFGLQAGICWRGTQDPSYPSQFVWVGPDGSRMVYHKLSDKGSYAPFDFAVRSKIRQDNFSGESYARYFEPYWREESQRAPLPCVLMLDAIDHQRPDPEMPRILKELKKRYPDIEFVWANLEEYGREIAQQADKLPERTGELRQPVLDVTCGAQYLIVHTLSSRYPIKKRNGQCQALLEKWAEPYALFDRMNGGAPVVSYLDKAWQYLLRNHPHDSICGCSIDQVHRDMQYRFDQAEMIGDGLVRRCMAKIGRASDQGEAWKNIVAHNPLPFRRTGVFEVALEFPADYPKKFVDGLATGQLINKFHLKGPDGKRLAYQHRALDRGKPSQRMNAIGRVPMMNADLCHVAVELDLPPCGYTSIQVEPTDDATRTFGSLMTGPLSASNGILDVSVQTDGTVTITLEKAKRSYTGLFLYEDCGDCGDGWTRGQLINDIVYRTPGSLVSAAVEEDGPLRTVFRIERTLLLPEKLDLPSYTRVERRIALHITDFLYVEKDSPCLRVHSVIQNTIQDHRLRVLFPTGIEEAEKSFAETPFALVERDIAIPEESAHWQERINPEKAFTSYFGTQDVTGGLAVLSPWGLHEYEVLQSPDHSLALTLFRATRQTVGTDGEPDGQLLQTLEFDYAIWPFLGAFDPAQAARIVAEMQTGIRVHLADQAPLPYSFLNIEPGKTVVTALKPAHDNHDAVIRFWNPGKAKVTEQINFNQEIKSASLCTLNEDPIQTIPVEKGHSVKVPVPPGGLATIRITF
ncbi:MAG TPA: hypothetical protein PLI09_23280 [Candidatus Hydrogenedentes bacterium]|nr:hypothetical protein [Candidatus Hydrogenedentota bacterium]